jgi:hypothetical protein
MYVTALKQEMSEFHMSRVTTISNNSCYWKSRLVESHYSRRGLKMKRSNWSSFFMVLLIALFGLCMLGGCDSGKKAVDEVTGNRAVKQYHQSKKDIEKIADKQAEKYGKIPGDDGKK